MLSNIHNNKTQRRYKRLLKKKNVKLRENHALSIFVISIVLLILFVSVSAATRRIPFTNFSFAQAESASILTHGPLVGAVSDTQATVWVRVDAPQTTILKVRYGLDPQTILQNTVDPPEGAEEASFIPVSYADTGNEAASWDKTWKAQLFGLSPSTKYYYAVFKYNKSLQVTVNSFRTFATSGQSVNFSFGVLTDFATNNSTQFPKRPNTQTFDHLYNRNPAFIVIGGDFWHNDAGDESPNAQKYIQRTRYYFKQMYSLNSPLGNFNSLVKKIYPNFSLVHYFDDHDMGTDNVYKDYQYKDEALAVLREYFPTYEMTQYGDWQKFSYGQADFFVLDGRSQRDNHPEPDGSEKSMLDGNNLGIEGQYHWLTQGLKNSAAKWKIIFSPSVFNPTHIKRDAWHGFEYERKKIVNFAKDNNIKGIVVISGDSHAGGIDDGTNSGFPEMFVPMPNSGQCLTTKGKIGKWSHGFYQVITSNDLDDPPCPGFGMVRVLTNPDRVVLKMLNDKNELKLSLRYFLNSADSAKYANLPEDE